MMCRLELVAEMRWELGLPQLPEAQPSRRPPLLFLGACQLTFNKKEQAQLGAVYALLSLVLKNDESRVWITEVYGGRSERQQDNRDAY